MIRRERGIFIFLSFVLNRFRHNIIWHDHIPVMVLGNYRMVADISRPLNNPVIGMFFFKPAFVTDKIFYLAPFVFSSCNPQYFSSLIP